MIVEFSFRHIHDVGWAATSLVRAGEAGRGSQHVRQFREAIEAQSLTEAATELADYAARLALGLPGLESEECMKLVTLLVDIQSMEACGVGPSASEARALDATVSESLRAGPRWKVGLLREELRRHDVHGANWWLPRLLLSQRPR